MIYVEPRAGLCNRMRVIESAYNLSKEYGAKVTVLWRKSKGLNCSYYDLFCENTMIQVIETKYKISLKFILRALKCKNKFLNIQYETSNKIEHLLKSNKEKNIYINTVFPFYSIKNYEIFEPTQEIKEKIDTICEKNFNANTIGIHIRRTDNINAIQYSPIELFEDFIRKKIEKEKNVRFYLSTDSIDVENKIISTFGSYIIVNHDKMWGRDSKQGMKDALIDLGCLSNCYIIVGSYYSSFSETAAQWGKTKELIILKK